jgi:hypothetical protein
MNYQSSRHQTSVLRLGMECVKLMVYHVLARAYCGRSSGWKETGAVAEAVAKCVA